MTGLTRILTGAMLVALQFLISQTACAKDFRVFTAIHDASAGSENEPAPVIARTVTIFHAGKVYDYIESANSAEIIVFEPTQRRFRILNPSRGIVATAAFDEIKQKLGVALEETAREVRVLSATEPERAKLVEMLTFQLSPQFETTFNQESLVLELNAEPISYRLETIRPEHPEIVSAYLDYADWVCRLNYVLTIGQILPEPRLALNRALRDRKVLPKTVVLKARTRPAVHLRAEHTFHLDLNSNERRWIYQWESLLNSKTIRHVTLQEYQQEVLTAQAP